MFADLELQKMIEEKPAKEDISVRGFFRVKITNEDGSLAGDSGWQKNQVTNEGFRNYLCRAIGAIANSLQVAFVAIGSGGLVNATDTTLPGEVVRRAAVTAATSNTSKAVQFTATFASSDSFVTNTQNISNIGLVNSSNVGTVFAGNTYASSSCATNQNVNISYTISFT